MHALLRRRDLGLWMVLAVVIIVAFFGSLDGEFVSDDLQMVQPNALLRSLDWQNIGRIFTSFDDANYMPLKVLSLAVDQAVWGPEPFGYHVTNLLLHLGCALLVFSVLVRLGLSRGAAFFISVLWAVHPLQVESVAWISERKNVLSGFFFFASFRAYLAFSARPGALRYIATILLFSLALLSKMNTLVLPAICLAFEMVYERRYRWRDLAATAPMFALGALTAWYNLTGSATHGGQYHGGSPIVTWLSSAVVVFRYLSHTVWPCGLISRYDVHLWRDPFDPVVFASLLGLVVMAAVTIWLIHRRMREAFWLLWFAITLGPMLNIVPFRSMMQDRYMYLALLGPLAFAGSWLDSVVRPTARMIIATAASVAVVACVLLTVRQVEYWSNPVSLWLRTATVRPLWADERIHHPDQFAKKLAQLDAAASAHPDNATLQNNLGALYFQAGRIQLALHHFERAHDLAPDESKILVNLGRAYTRLHRFDDAERHLARAFELWPYDFMACYYLLRAYLEKGDVDAARETLGRCSKLHDGLMRERVELQRLETAGMGSSGPR